MSVKYPKHAPVTKNYNGQHMYPGNQGWQRHSFNRRPGFYNRQVTDQRRLSKSWQNNDNNTICLTALEGYSTRQAHTQTLLNSLQEYDASDRNATILWLDHIELVTEKMGIDPLEVGISKLKGIVLGDINTIHKEGNLMWYRLRQRLIENYSNVPYVSDAMLHILTCCKVMMN